MLQGEYNHNLDDKGRLIIPKNLRDDLGESVVVCNGLDGCLFVYPQPEWDKLVSKLMALPLINEKARNTKRHFIGSSATLEYDKQGRVTLPPSLRKFAGLQKEVVLVGVLDKLEVWNLEAWEEEQQKNSINMKDIMSGLADDDIVF